MFYNSSGISSSRGYRVIQKFAFVAFLLCCLTGSMTASAQSERISIDTKRAVTLPELFSKIEKSSTYLFQYKNEDIPEIKVKISMRNATVSEILDLAFKNTDLSYVLNERFVIIEKLVKKQDKAVHKRKNPDLFKVHGVVTDSNGEYIPGVVVFEESTTSNAVTTGVNGDYSITLEGGANSTIVFSCMGYHENKVKLSAGRSRVNIILEEDNILLDEVVVVGYGVQKKLNLTGSVTSTSGKVLADRPIGNVAQGLQGIIPNLNITFNSGKPDTQAKINIRGNTSLNGGSALILLDGVEISDLSLVNPQDVENISVLKDASAAAVYGARAAFGVMLITTKKGANNQKVQVNYNNNLSWNMPARLPEMPRSDVWARMWNKARDYDNPGDYYFSDKFLAYLDAHIADPEHNPGIIVDTEGIQDGKHTPNNPGWAYVSNTDWLKEFYRSSGFMHQHNLSVSGGSNKVKYYGSIGYKDQQGIFRQGNDHYNRINANLSVDINICKWLDAGLSARMNYVKNDEPNVDFQNNSGYTLYYEVYRMFPTVPVYLHNGEFAGMKGNHMNFNIIGKMALAGRKIDTTLDQWYTARLNIHPIEGLSIKGDFSFNPFFRRQKFHGKTFYQTHPEGRDPELIGEPNNVSNNHVNNNYLALNVWAEYKHTFGKAHNLGVMLGYNQEEKNYYSNSLTMTNLYDNNLPVTDMASNYLKNNEISTLWRVQGAFFRLNYDYDSRYIVEVSGRYDGSSKYHKDNRWAYFPSASFGWNIAREKFVTDNTNAIDELKIRFSTGALGNQVTRGYHDYMSIIESRPINNFVFDGKLENGFRTPTIPDFVTWEKVVTYDVGLDYSFLGNRLNGAFDYYIRDTKGMIRPVTLPDTFGTSSGQENAADMRTMGWEFELKWRDRINDVAGSPFDYSIGVGLSDYHATITKYDNPTGILSSYYKGMHLGEIWGYTTSGFIQTEEEAAEMNGVQKFFSSKWHPGDIRYADLDGNGKVDQGNYTLSDHGDLSIIGNSTPRYRFNINGGIGWHGFNLDFVFDGVCKRDLWVGSDIFWGFARDIYNSSVTQYHVDNIWTEEHTDAYYPRLSFSDSSKNKKVQTKYLQNAAYLRLKNLTFSYSLPQKALDKLRIAQARIYVTGMNVFEITGLPPFMTPDIADNINDNKFDSPNSGKEYAFMRSWSLGVNITF